MSSMRVLLFALLSTSAVLAFAVPGDLDASFGAGGEVVITAPGGCGSQSCGGLRARSIAYQADGSIIVSADWYQFASPRPYCSGYDNEMVVMRRLADGRADPSFAAGGMARAGGSTRAGPIVAMPDGKILVAGSGFSPSVPALCGDRVIVTRFNADGSRDTGFGSNGTAYGMASVWTNDATAQARVDGLALQPDGKILVAVLTAGEQAQVLRFLPDGQPDSSYGVSGVATVSTGAARYRGPVPLALQGDKVLVATVARSSADSAIVVRLQADGSMDTSFGGGGTASLGPAAPDDRIMSLAVQAGGRILVSAQGGPTTNGMANGLISGLLPDGAFDSSFALGGQRPTLYPRSFALQPDGRFLAAGRERMDRWMPEGWLDATFAPQGLATFDDKVIAANADKAAVANTASNVIRLWQFQAGRTLDIFRDRRLFVTAQYRDFFYREGEASGIAYWAGQIDSGALSRGQLIETFFSSPEFQGTIAPVARLYFAYFLRIPDFAGLQFWIENYRTTKNLDGISAYFERSSEFASRYGALDNGQFVDLVYQNLLGRAPDPGGRAFWTGELDSGSRTRGQVMLWFSESNEYRALTASEVYVTMMYVGMMRRVPDPGGFSFWVDYLDRGNPGLALIDGFLYSTEYRNRFLP